MFSRGLSVLVIWLICFIPSSAQQYTTKTYHTQGDKLAKVWDQRAEGLKGDELAKKIAEEFVLAAQEDFWEACQAMMEVRLVTTRASKVVAQLPARENRLVKAWAHWYGDQLKYEDRLKNNPPVYPSILPRPGQGLAGFTGSRPVASRPPAPKNVPHFPNGTVLKWTGVTDGILLIQQKYRDGRYTARWYFPKTGLHPKQVTKTGDYLQKHCRVIGSGWECHVCSGVGKKYETRKYHVPQRYRADRHALDYDPNESYEESGNLECLECQGWGVLFKS